MISRNHLNRVPTFIFLLLGLAFRVRLEGLGGFNMHDQIRVVFNNSIDLIINFYVQFPTIVLTIVVKTGNEIKYL